MTDLTAVLPGFPVQQYAHLLPSLEKNLVTTADLITLDCVEIAKRAQLPLLEVKRLCNEVLEALQVHLGVKETDSESQENRLSLRKSGKDIGTAWSTISTLDDKLDVAIGGGIPTGYITEVTGESGAGKTQFLLTLLLSVQLPPPHGLSSAALYVSTESALPTSRLSQLLATHPLLLSSTPKPTLDAVICIVTPDLESQDHILRYQVPVAIRRHGIRLIILDSVAANYRAEFERPGAAGVTGQSSGANMSQRSTDLIQLGKLFRDIAREENIAIVVANQVSDRFSSGSGGDKASLLDRATGGVGGLSSNSMTAQMFNLPTEIGPAKQKSSTFTTSTTDPLSLDHQQRWFTGWGDEPNPSQIAMKSLKTPSLGLIWTNQIAYRVALVKRPIYGPILVANEENEKGELVLRKWRRWMKVVFAPHAGPSGPGLNGAVEFEILGSGIRSVIEKQKGEEETGGI